MNSMNRHWMTFLGILLVGVTFALTPAYAASYYVSPSGNDNNSGTSPTEAWQTIDKVNSVTFSAGDSILFEGGQTFSGQLVFDNESGTSASPITVSSYSTGQATLSNPTMGVEGSPSFGLKLYNVQGFHINNLILVGPGNLGDRWDENIGLFMHAQLAEDARLDYFRIDNLDISDYSGRGIYVFGENYSGFRDVQITNCVFHNIGTFGINTDSNRWPRTKGSHNDFYIANNEMFDITGVGARSPHSGSGITLSAVDGALVEFNLAYSGGELCMAEGGGPLGIWCWETENVVFQFNEVHDWQTLGGDGGGFDLDGGTSFGIVQYNYSHDNFGGDLLMQFGRSRPAHDYIYRYNVNANQAQLNEMGAVTFYSDTSGEPHNVEVYNNTFYVGPDSVPGASAVAFWKWKGGNYQVNLRNNIFMAEAGRKLINYTAAGVGDVTFQNNIYWQSGAPLAIDVAGTVYSSLAAWRAATGQEMLDGSPVGMEIGPQLVDVHDHPALGPANLANLDGYKLKAASQARDAGLDLQALFGIDPGPHDFYGNPIPQGSLFDIGSHEFPGGGSAPAPDSTAPAAPSGLMATANASSIDLDWADNTESDLSHYSVKRSTSPSGPYTQIISNLNTSTYSDRSVSASTTYNYVVSAVDTSSNESADSGADFASITYPGELIFSDGFESGDFIAGDWETFDGSTGGTAQVNTEAAFEGTYGAKIGKLAAIRKQLITVGFTDIRIRYRRNTINSDRWGCSFVWWDGSDMHSIEKSIGEPWGLTEIFAGPDADNNPDFYLFIRDNDPGPSDRTFVDNVEIWGIREGAPPPPDDNPPTVTITAPAEGATVSGTITISADASDDVGVEGVQFQVDGTNLGAEDTTAPYEINWDTTTVADGSHTLTAVARDTANQTRSDSINVTVDNAAPPPPGGTVMHVADVFTTDSAGNPKDAFTKGERVFWQVLIQDAGGSAVGGAEVTTQALQPGGGVWVQPTATTDANGWAFFSQKSQKPNPTGTHTINVTNVVKTAATYDPAANVKDSHQFTLQ